METLKILLVTMLPLLAGACRLNGGQPTPDTPVPEPEPIVKQDTTYHTSNLDFRAPFPVLWTDILVYRSDGLKDLTAYLHSDGPTAELCLTDSLQKNIAVVANARGRFNLQGLQHFDSLGGIVVRLADEDPDAPIMSGIFSIRPGRDTTLALTPLLCTIELISVTNYYDGDRLAENPRVRLENVNAEAELFREQDFAVREITSGQTVFLPYDIGLYTQHPHTRLQCYPNDLPNPGAGNPATELVLECEIEGVTWSRRYTFHPLMRGETIQFEAEIRPYGEDRP